MSGVREWIPISSSPKGRLVLAALAAFSARPFADVTVGELARAANVTTGALYHHFDGKPGLYAFVRADVEQRLVDRMEGAAAGADGPGGGRAALLVGFDFAVAQGFLHLLAAAPAEGADRVAAVLRAAAPDAPPLLADLLASAWRAALAAVIGGADPADARAALERLAAS